MKLRRIPCATERPPIVVGPVTVRDYEDIGLAACDYSPIALLPDDILRRLATPLLDKVNARYMTLTQVSEWLAKQG